MDVKVYPQTQSNNNCNMLNERLPNAIFGKVGRTASKQKVCFATY